MNNITLLRNNNNKNVRLFAETIDTLKNAQGFYSRLYYEINEMAKDGLDDLIDTVSKQNFKDVVDVVLWLEG